MLIIRVFQFEKETTHNWIWFTSEINVVLWQNTWFYLRRMQVSPSLGLPSPPRIFNCIFCPVQLQMVIFDFAEEGTGTEHVAIATSKCVPLITIALVTQYLTRYNLRCVIVWTKHRYPGQSSEIFEKNCQKSRH